MSESFLRVLTHEIHLAALGFMGLVYLIRIIWLFKFAAPAESTPARGSHSAGITYAMTNIALPWQIESYRNKPMRYVEFVIFHVGVLVAIAAAIMRPETDASLFASNNFWGANPIVGQICAGILAAATLMGIFRMIRRFGRPEMRAISSPDDYFSIILLNVWMGTGVLGVQAGAPAMITGIFYIITTFFLVYVPFSKISHYLYYPFNKYYVGKHLGHRGVYPKGQPVVVSASGAAGSSSVVGEESKASI